MEKVVLAQITGSDGAQYLLYAMDRNDRHLHEAYCALLSDLTVATPISPEAWEAAFSPPSGQPCGAWVVTYLLLHRETDQLAGTARLVFERKLIRGGVLAGHLEDVVISRGHQGHGLGARLVQAVKEEARKAGCYKLMLHCREDLESFYEKAGAFQRHAIGMACRFS